MSFANRGESADEGGNRRARIYAAVILTVLALAVPWLVLGVMGALDSNSNDPRQWLPRGSDETAKYRWFQQCFGGDEITIVSWPECTLEDTRLEQVGRSLVEEPEVPYFRRAVTASPLIRKLTRSPANLSRRSAIRRLRGILVGPDGKTTCLVLTISERGATDREGAVARVRRVVEQAYGLAPEQVHLGGPTVDAATINVESQRLLLELAGLSGLIALTITWLRMRSIRLAAIIMVCAVYCTGVALSILYYTGGNMNLVMTMLPPLMFVLGVSAAVHLTNYYRDALKEGSGEGAALRALAAGWRPCALASGTTAGGLLSLAVSNIMPVKMFGIYAAAGMCASLLVVLLFLPSALILWPERAVSRTSVRDHYPKASRRDRAIHWICRHHVLVSVGCLVLMLVAARGLPQLRSTVKLQYRFRPNSQIIQDYRWLEKHLGPLVPLEVVVHFSGENRPAFLDQLRFVARVHSELSKHSGVGAVLSGVNFVPFLPRGGSIRNVARRSMLRARVPELEHLLRQSHYLAQGDGNETLWRISVRAPALGDLDYGRFVESLRKELAPTLAGVAGTRLTYTGVIPLIYKAQRELLGDLVESFFLAFGVIALVMMITLRGIRSGLLAMVPNVFPAVTLFGLMGWLKIPIEIGSIMTASAAMGIAVDDTFHFLTWFRAGVGRSLPRD